VYLVLFAVYVCGSLLWLTLGLIPSLAPSLPVLGHALESLDRQPGALGSAAHRFMMHGPFSQHGIALAVAYVFSALNLALGILLAVRRPYDLVPRLLSVAFIGTAATFNAPSHEIFHVIGTVPIVTALHFSFHIVSGVAYVWAVLLFPDGRLPLSGGSTRRWESVAVAVTTTVLITVVCYESSFLAHPPFFVAFFGILVPTVGMLAQGLRLRDRSQPPAARQQSRLLRLALIPALVVSGLWLAAHVVALGDPGAGRAIARTVELAFPAVFAVVPVMLFVAILRYRLWDIDLVVTRAFAYTSLAAFIALVYAVTLGATGWIFRSDGWSAVVAMAVVAVGVEPVRERLRRLANQLVFGQRLEPREAVRALVNRFENAAANDGLAELTSVVVAGTRCSGAELWLVSGDHLLLVAASPTSDLGQRRPLPATGTDLPGTDVCVPVTHERSLLAVLALRLPSGVRLPRPELKLVRELAGHAGLLVANARLTDGLARQVELVMARAADLERSRLQVVAAHDDERRLLERDIHDGAQQELVAVLIQLRALQRLPADRERPAEQLAALREALAATQTTLRQLCTGDPPAVLTESGLAAALDTAVAPMRRSGVDVRVTGSTGSRLPPDIESALYFCALEALQNASKHAGAGRVLVRLESVGDEAVLSVDDDGVGFDPTRAGGGSGLSNLVDRLAVLGGTVEIRSAPDTGTRLSCRVPLARELTGAGA